MDLRVAGRGPPRRGWQVSEHPVEQWRQCFGRDVADHADDQVVAREARGREVAQVPSGEPRDRFEGALHRPGVGVVAEDRAPPDSAGDRVRVGRFAFQPDGNLAAHPFDRLRVEAWRVEREPQQFRRLVPVAVQGLEAAANRLRSGAETEPHRQILEPSLECLAVEIAGAVVEQARRQVCQTRLAFGVGRGAAAKGKLDRRDRNAAVAHQPGFDAGGTDHPFDSDRLGGKCGDREKKQAENRGQNLREPERT